MAYIFNIVEFTDKHVHVTSGEENVRNQEDQGDAW